LPWPVSPKSEDGRPRIVCAARSNGRSVRCEQRKNVSRNQISLWPDPAVSGALSVPAVPSPHEWGPWQGVVDRVGVANRSPTPLPEGLDGGLVAVFPEGDDEGGFGSGNLEGAAGFAVAAAGGSILDAESLGFPP
jgi:hypothetical protein